MVEIGAMYMGGSGFTPKGFAVAVEKAGFDSLWAGDHILHYVDGIATLGAFAGCTDAITLGTNVIVLPFRPAPVTAKGVLTAAYIAQRRVIMGVGVGGDVPSEFQLVGADIKTRGAYSTEALATIKTLWSGERVSIDGRWTSVNDVVMQPKLATLPEIWVGGRSEGSLRRALAHGTGYVPYLISPEQLASRIGRLRGYAAEEGRDLSNFTMACTTFLIPAGSADAAVDLAVNRVGFQGVDADRLRRFYLLGSEDECIARLREYIAAGAQHIVIGCPPAREDQLEAYIASAVRLRAAVQDAGAAASSSRPAASA